MSWDAKPCFSSSESRYHVIGTRNFHYCETMSFTKPSFFIVRTESICKYVCSVYHQLLQYVAKLRGITIDLCKSRFVTIETEVEGILKLLLPLVLPLVTSNRSYS
jgi:hypothetical protein